MIYFENLRKIYWWRVLNQKRTVKIWKCVKKSAKNSGCSLAEHEYEKLNLNLIPNFEHHLNSHFLLWTFFRLGRFKWIFRGSLFSRYVNEFNLLVLVEKEKAGTKEENHKVTSLSEGSSVNEIYTYVRFIFVFLLVS